MSNLKGRVDKLEAAIGEPGPWCECRGTSVVVNWGDALPAEDALAEKCDRCGKPIVTKIVRWPDDERNERRTSDD